MPEHVFTSSIGAISNEEQIKALVGQQLVTLHNEITGNVVKRFGDKKVGLRRTLQAFGVWRDQQDGKAPKVVTPDNKSYRPDSLRGKVIELSRRAGGATFKELKAETKWDDGELKAAIARIKSYLELTVTVTGEGDEAVVVVSGILRTRKAFAFPAKKEQREHKPNTKRCKVLDVLVSKEGATFADVQTLTGWDDRTAYEGIRLIHGYLGYGLRETPDGRIFAFTA